MEALNTLKNQISFHISSLVLLVLFFLAQVLQAQNQPPGNRGLYFDGSDDYVDLGSQATLNNAFADNFTIECWIKIESYGSQKLILSSWDEGNIASRIQFGLNDVGGLILKETFGNQHPSPGGSVPLRQWTHVAVTFDGFNIRYFVNGALNTTIAKTGNTFAGPSLPFLVGVARQFSSALLDPFLGQIDELRVFNTARSEAQILSDMNSTAAEGAVGFWRFEESTGQNTADSSGNNLTGTIGSSALNDTNDPLWALRVKNTDDSQAESLRDVITQANNLAGTHYVDFNLLTTDANYNPNEGGYWSIKPLSTLPVISESIILDAWTQPGFVNKPLIEIDGINLTNSFGVLLTANNCIIRGFAINNFQGTGGDNIAIEIFSSNNTISGNYIGTDISGNVAKPNGQAGIWVNQSYSNNLIGSNLDGISDDLERNVISGNSGRGGFILDGGTNLIQGNYIGTNAAGTSALPNEAQGIESLRGGANTIQNNLISGNNGEGLYLQSDNNLILNNLIGTDITGTNPLPNSLEGIVLESSISTASNNRIGDGTNTGSNIIAYNNTGGIKMSGGINNKISRNAIFCNLNSSISLQNNANNNKPAPTITNTTNLQITGTCQSGDVVEIFSDNPECGASNQGRTYLGNATVSGTNWTLSGSFADGDRITAIATDASNNTSAFSAASVVGASTAFALDFDGTDDFVNFGNDALSNELADSFTLEAWVKPNSLNNDIGINTLLSRWEFGNFSSAFYIYVGNTGFVSISNIAGVQVGTPEGTVPVGVWTHIALSYDSPSSLISIYIDGALSGQAVIEGGISASNSLPLLLGALINDLSPTLSTANHFDGQLDEVRIWNGVRTCEQIKDGLFCELDTANAPDLIAYYTFNQNTGALLSDLKETNPGTLTNFALTGTNSNWVQADNDINGICSTAGIYPEISLFFNDLEMEIALGDTITVSPTSIGSSQTFLFSIQNLGGISLNLSPIEGDLVNISGSPDFSVSIQPANASISGEGGSEFFEISFSPSTAGIQSAALSIQSDDCDEALYTFMVIAEGIEPSDNALHLDGGDDYARTRFSPPNGDQTYEIWVKADESSTGFKEALSVSGTFNGATEHLLLGLNNSGMARFGLYDYFNGQFQEVNGTSAIRDNSWHHLAGVVQGANIYLYVDGILEGSSALSPDNIVRNSTDSLRIGALIFEGSLTEFFKGELDELRIWNVARSCSEIQSNLYNKLNGSEAGLEIYYNFDQGIAEADNTELPAPELTDITGSERDGFLINFNKTGTTSNFIVSTLDLSTSNPIIPTEITVLGNGLEILNGDNTPSTADNTDFGTVNFGQPLTISFTIQNTGLLPLLISEITSSNTDFALSNVPLSIDSLDSANFTITFTPGVSGVSTITIFSSDCDESVYTFDISAIASNIPINTPTNLRVLPISETQIALSWEDNANNESNYIIERKEGASGQFVTLVILPANTQNYVDNGLTPGITYFYRIRAIATFSVSQYSEVLGAVTGVPTPIEQNSLEIATKVFPNPSEDHTTLQIQNTYIGQLEIILLDAQGKIIRQKNLLKNKNLFEITIDLSSEAQGLYYLIVKQEKTSISRKISRK
ncbi:MAG: LamG-like jellyroll fold domain-containing protein [Microscillaceae bacterium]|nr:LamG-like jellyroll fold domain-containing protein [Microscillaceae bacterium]